MPYFPIPGSRGRLGVRRLTHLARKRVGTLRRILLRTDWRFKTFFYPGFRDIERAPWWFRLVWRKHPRIAIAEFLLRKLARIIARQSYGGILWGYVFSKVLYGLIRTRYKDIIDWYLKYEAYFRYRQLELIYSRMLDKALRKYAIPILYIEYKPYMGGLNEYRVLDPYLQHLDPVIRTQIIEGLVNIARGRISLSEARKQYPFAVYYLERIVNSYQRLGPRISKWSLLVTPLIIEMEKDVLKMYFMAYRIPISGLISNPWIGKAGRIDPHFQFARFKPYDEIYDAIGWESDSYYQIWLLLNDLGLGVFEGDYLMFYVEPTMVKTFISIGHGQPENWWEIEAVEPRASPTSTYTRYFTNYFRRRRYVYTIVRTLPYLMGWRV